MIAACCACHSGTGSNGHEATAIDTTQASSDDAAQLEVHVLHRKQMALPPTATVTVTMEEVATSFAHSIWSNPTDQRWRSRGLIKTVVERTIHVDGGPPYVVRLTYDPSGLSPEGSYSVRARIENANQILFMNAGYIPVFGADGSAKGPVSQPIEIVTRRVAGADEQEP
jgi:uncharacterized lipoprotein YbaY